MCNEGIEMNRDRIEGNWKQAKGKSQELWGRMTDDQLHKFDGMRMQLAGKMQEQFGIAKDEALRQLKDFRKRYRNWNPSNIC